MDRGAERFDFLAGARDSPNGMNRYEFVEQLHNAPGLAVVVITGGGVVALTDLLTVPGASRTLLEARVPYSEESLATLLGFVPEQAVSAETAVAIAGAAYRLGAPYGGGDCGVVGLGCTATLATDRPKRGDHRAYIATHSGTVDPHVVAVTLDKGARTRAEEDRFVSDVILEVLAESFGLSMRFEKLNFLYIFTRELEISIVIVNSEKPSVHQGSRS